MNHLDLTKFKSCKCGITVESEYVEVKHYYSWLGWFWWSMGATAIPKKITFSCKKCNLIFEILTDTDLIKHFIFYRRY